MKILVLGATSDIAASVCRLYAEQGAELHLVGRREGELGNLKKDLLFRGAKSVVLSVVDFKKALDAERVVVECLRRVDKFDLLLFSYGLLGNQNSGTQDLGNLEHVEEILFVNFISQARLLSLVAPLALDGKIDQIAVISSVAGLRGRKSNFVYGSAMAGKNAFLSGLRALLHGNTEVHVATILPGFVATKMTAHLRRGFLNVSSETAAKSIVRGLLARKDIIYAPWFWRYIMFAVRFIPECIFRRLNF